MSMRETPSRQKALALKNDPLLMEVLAWSLMAPERWEGAAPGAALIQLRRRMGASQRELAERSGVSQTIIQRIESGGDFCLSSLRRLLGVMGFEPKLAICPKRRA